MCYNLWGWNYLGWRTLSGFLFMCNNLQSLLANHWQRQLTYLPLGCSPWPFWCFSVNKNKPIMHNTSQSSKSINPPTPVVGGSWAGILEILEYEILEMDLNGHIVETNLTPPSFRQVASTPRGRWAVKEIIGSSSH